MQGVKVLVPSQETERSKLSQVGIVAAVCFAIGLIWPTLAGVRLVPEPPNKADESKAEPATPKPRKPEPPSHPPKEIPAAANVPASPERTTEMTVDIEEVLVVNCRDGEDRRLNECDKPAFEDIATDRLKALVTCEAAQGANGLLSIGFDLDFSSQKIRRILRGKSTTLDDATADALIECAEREFMSATLQGLEHTHAKYLVFFLARFVPPGTPTETATDDDPIIAASGTATVIWNSARLRATPKDGEVKTQLVYGTKVIVTARQGDWYRVKYDGRGNEAWVHKNALAM